MRIEDLHFDLPTKPVDVTTWDQEKWRNENPMDYFKAVYLILSAPDSLSEIDHDIAMAVTFKNLYKVIRLYIPTTLYKFYSLTDDVTLNSQKLSTLRNKQVYMSAISDFNDPFDGKAFYYNPKSLAEIKRLQEHGGRLIDDFTTFNRGTAFTENDTGCMPMWAHYSNNHRGYCVAYDMKAPENLELSSSMFPIQYTDQRLDITSYMKKYAEMVSEEADRQIAQGRVEILLKDMSIVYLAVFLCNIKQRTWQYEKEFRCTVATNAEGMPYVTAVPKAIYVGMNCAEENRNELMLIAKQLSVPIYQMQLDALSENFVLVEKPLDE